MHTFTSAQGLASISQEEDAAIGLLDIDPLHKRQTSHYLDVLIMHKCLPSKCQKDRYIPCFSSNWTAHRLESSVPLSAKQGAILGKLTFTTLQTESTVQQVLQFHNYIHF